MIPLSVLNFIGNWLYETNKVFCEPQGEDSRDPDDFCPGVLFGLSASWVSLLRTLMIPEYARKGLPPPCGTTCGSGPCPLNDRTSSSTTTTTSSDSTCGAPSSTDTSSSDRCKKSSSRCSTGGKKKKSKFAAFKC